MSMYTFQDFEGASDREAFVLSAIEAYRRDPLYLTALDADEYDAQRNVTISKVVPKIFNVAGVKVDDPTASNNRIASNFFHRLVTQRCTFSLGSGVSFIDPYEAMDDTTDETKERLGPHFDHTIYEAGFNAIKHGVSYLFWDVDRVYDFSATELVPLVDEYDGSLRAAIRFWQLDRSKPLNAVLYEQDGLTVYRRDDGGMGEVEPKRAYKLTYSYTNADGTVDVKEENYSRLPIVRVYGSSLKQSALVGMRSAIDAYDIVKSGFANDLADVAQVYWIVENYGGMDDDDLRQFLDRLKLNHVANADTQSGGKVTPYSQEIPYAARQALLTELRNGIYEDFGALDVHTVSAGATNDHIDAAYQPMEENAADFEHWVSDAIVQLLSLQGIDDVPQFRHIRVSNQKEQVEMLVQEAAWLDQRTILRKLPNLSAEEVGAVIAGLEGEDMERMLTGAIGAE